MVLYNPIVVSLFFKLPAMGPAVFNRFWIACLVWIAIEYGYYRTLTGPARAGTGKIS